MAMVYVVGVMMVRIAVGQFGGAARSLLGVLMPLRQFVRYLAVAWRHHPPDSFRS